MVLSEKLVMLRKQNGFSQEELAEKLKIARQTVSKWETGLAIPELDGLISLSRLYGIPIDRIVKNDDDCNLKLSPAPEVNRADWISFLIRAKRNCYAGHGAEVEPSRPKSHDLKYAEKNLLYIDTYIGGEKFAGEEALWQDGIPVWSMNYCGRVTGEHFSGDFLKEALYNIPTQMCYRGPELYQNGDYVYHCKAEGSFDWYQGYEDIFYSDRKVYKLYFHGGVISS